MKAYLTVLRKSQQQCISIDGLYEDTLHLWQGIIPHCAKNLSNKQVVDVHKQLSTQLHKMGKDDTPLVYMEMFEEFKKGMEERKITI